MASERHPGFLVTLRKNIPEEDLKELCKAIEQFKGVISCKPVGNTYETHFAEERTRRDLGDKLLKVLFPDWDPPGTLDA